MSGEVLPGGIVRFDELDFLLAGPRFDFFFAGDGVEDVGEGFEVDQAVYSVTLGEARVGGLAMLECAVVKVAGDTGVESAGTVGEDVHGVGFGHGDLGLRAEN